MAKYVHKSKFLYHWPVSVSLPGEQAGKMEAFTFTAQFQTLPAVRAADLLASGPAALMREALTGWSGVTDEGGNELPFSEDVRETLLESSWVLIGLMKAWTAALGGEPAGSRG